jgi:hypothetical protein
MLSHYANDVEVTNPDALIIRFLPLGLGMNAPCDFSSDSYIKGDMRMRWNKRNKP